MNATPTPLPADRDILRQACREALPCVIVVPGRPQWGSSLLLALREAGPRPQLAVAQPVDPRSGTVRSLGIGESIRIVGVRESVLWTLDASVEGVGVVESAAAGPLSAAILRLPFRLHGQERRLVGRTGPTPPTLLVETLRDGHPSPPRTALASWWSPEGGPRRRGGAQLLEVSRRSASLAVPLADRHWLVRGGQARITVEHHDPPLRTSVSARVEVVLPLDEWLLLGLALGEQTAEISPDEHRETMRLAAAFGAG